MYQMLNHGVLRLSDGAVIPPDSGNKDWQEYQAWLLEGNIPVPLPSATLVQAQTVQISILAEAYNNAISQPVSFTSAGNITKTYNADMGSISNLQMCILGYMSAQATPSGFYWVAADNTQVPFTYSDLKALAAVMMAQGWAAFQHLQTQKAAVNAAVTVAAVQAIVW